MDQQPAPVALTGDRLSTFWTRYGPWVIFIGGFLLRHYLPQIPLPPMQPPPAPPAAVVPNQPAPAPAPAPAPLAPLAATAKIAMNNGFCSCTVIGPQQCPGRWDVLCAGHCFGRVGEVAVIHFRDGSTARAAVAAIDHTADYAWLSFASPRRYDYLELAAAPPSPRAELWCGGFGPPANGDVRRGSYVGTANHGQLRYSITVYHGDSGSAVVDSASGRVVGIVCTTDFRGNTFGTSCVTVSRGRPRSCPSPADYSWHALTL